MFFLVGFLVSILVMSLAVYLMVPEYRALQTTSELQSSCNKGNYVSCHRLVEHYRNRCAANKWDDCINMGDYYWLKHNNSESYIYYKKACGHDQQLGCYYLALLSEKGDGVPVDENLAKEHYDRLCKKKLDKACVRLGDMYWSGRAVSKDPAQALHLYQSACEQDNPTGCYRIGQMYETGADKVPQNIALAYAHYDQACNHQEYLPACLTLGLLYYKQKVQDASNMMAYRAFDKACAQGSGELDACINLGRIFEEGLNGQKYPERAIAEYKNACDRKHAGGCANLGLLYSHPNTPYYNLDHAMRFLRISCKTGLDQGCYNYALVWYRDKWNETERTTGDSSEIATILLESCRRQYKKSCSLVGELARRRQIDQGAALIVLEQICKVSGNLPSNSGCEAWLQLRADPAGMKIAR